MAYFNQRRAPLSGLGQGAALATIRGVVTYHTGKEETYRRMIHDTRMSVCEERAAVDPLTVCVPTRDKKDSAGNVIPWAIEYRDEPRNDQRIDGSAGWQLYVPDLIPTTGGSLPGYALLEGPLPDLVSGKTYTLQGEWTSTRPNNLCVNCGWPFRVVAEAAAGAEVDTGAIDQDSDDMVLARLRAIETSQDDPEAGAIADELERGEITVDQAVEKDAALQIERQATAAGETEGPDTEPADGDTLPPLTTAGFGFSKGALALGGLLLLPILFGGTKRWD